MDDALSVRVLVADDEDDIRALVLSRRRAGPAVPW